MNLFIIIFIIFNILYIVDIDVLFFVIWMKCCIVDWIKMIFDFFKFFFKYEMVESGIEFVNFGGCGGDIYGFLIII